MIPVKISVLEEPSGRLVDVRFGSKADVTLGADEARLTSESRH